MMSEVADDVNRWNTAISRWLLDHLDEPSEPVSTEMVQTVALIDAYLERLRDRHDE